PGAAFPLGVDSPFRITTHEPRPDPPLAAAAIRKAADGTLLPSQAFDFHPAIAPARDVSAFAILADQALRSAATGISKALGPLPAGIALGRAYSIAEADDFLENPLAAVKRQSTNVKSIRIKDVKETQVGRISGSADFHFAGILNVKTLLKMAKARTTLIVKANHLTVHDRIRAHSGRERLDDLRELDVLRLLVSTQQGDAMVLA